MTVKSTYNGNEIKLIDARWVYDDGTPANMPRKCPKCGKLPDVNGHDNCLGALDGVSSACCGHGVEEIYIMLRAEQ